MCSFTLSYTHAHNNSATGYYCSQTPIKTWVVWGISVLNEIKSGLLVVAGLLVILPGWHWWHFSLPSSLLLLNLSYNTAVYLLSSRRLISYITTSTQHCHYTINTEGLFHSTACRHVFVFLNGPHNVKLHKSFMGNPSRMLTPSGWKRFCSNQNNQQL